MKTTGSFHRWITVQEFSISHHSREASNVKTTESIQIKKISKWKIYVNNQASVPKKILQIASL